MDFLIIDDDRTFRDATRQMVEDEGHYAEGADSGRSGLTRLKEDKFEVVLLDLNLGPENGLDVLSELQQRYPDLPVIILTAQGNVQTAVETMRRGALDFLEKPFHREQFLTVLTRLQRFNQLGRRIEKLETEATQSRSETVEPIFEFPNASMREVWEIMLRAAQTPASILILGESGTGKSVAARAVHKHSQLADKPFVTVSCPSLSRELLESELFGHVKGTFTGAVNDRWGKVKAAHGGTLFLDEIGDLPMEIQPKLLRLLQEREYERLGENVVRKAEIRVIAATNRDLKARVREGTFREDLYFRLNVIAVEIPPLRQRPDDLNRLAEHYLEYFCRQCGRPLKGFTDEALAAIRQHGWPGNLRELRNAIERAVILTKADRIEAAALPAELRSGSPDSTTDTLTAMAGVPMVSLEKLEELHIRRALAQTSSLAEAAELLGIDQATLYRKRKKLGLD